MRGRVFQRAKGRGKPWSYVVDVGVGANGKRRQRLKGGFHTRAEAEKALAELLVQVDKGMAVDPSRQTLGEYLDDWLAAVAPSLRPTTADLYRRAVDNWVRPRLGDLPLQSVRPKHLQDLYAELLVSGRADGSGGLSSRSVRLAHQVLRLALERAVDWRLIARNPATARLDLPRLQHQPMQTWTAADAKPSWPNKTGKGERQLGMKPTSALHSAGSLSSLVEGWSRIVTSTKRASIFSPPTPSKRRSLLSLGSTPMASAIQPAARTCSLPVSTRPSCRGSDCAAAMLTNTTGRNGNRPSRRSCSSTNG